MSQLSLAFLVAAVVAAAVGFGGVVDGVIGGGGAYAAQVLAFVLLALAAGFFIASRRSHPIVGRRW